MAQQIANPGVQNGAEDPVFFHMDSNAYDGISELVNSVLPLDDDCMFDTSILDIPEICYFLYPPQELKYKPDENLKKMLMKLEERRTLKINEKLEHMLKLLSFSRADGCLGDDLRLLNTFTLDCKKYDCAGCEGRHSSFGKVYKGFMFRKARSEQQLGSHKIVCQDSGVESKGDVQWNLKSMSGNGKHFPGQSISKVKLFLELSGNFQERPLSSIGSYAFLSPENEEPCVSSDLMEFSEMIYYSTLCNSNKHKKTISKDPTSHLDNDAFNQNKCKETAQCVSSILIFSIPCLWFLLMTFSQTLFRKHSVATMTNVQPLHKEHGPLSIVVPLLGLFSFVMFVWAVATMILAGAKFAHMHTAMLLFLAILIAVRSNNSINSMYFPIGMFIIGRYARRKSDNDRREILKHSYS